jgi:hypothetical protein
LVEPLAVVHLVPPLDRGVPVGHLDVEAFGVVVIDVNARRQMEHGGIVEGNHYPILVVAALARMARKNPAQDGWWRRITNETYRHYMTGEQDGEERRRPAGPEGS